MTDLLTPNDLPGGSGANFVAYGSSERVADPQTGDAISVRPQVFVKYFPQIKVKELQEGGRSGDKKGLVTVHFDPTSVSIGEDRTLKEEIKAHVDADESTLDILREAQENDRYVGVGIETQRKAKNADSKAPISPLTPIHALRGAKEPDGTGATMNDSYDNTSNRLALVNGRSTKHILSDPAEWKALANNRAGDLPPEGWRNYAPGEDWTQYGAAVQSENSAGGQGAHIDQDGLLSAIKGIVDDALAEHVPEGPFQQASGRPISRGGGGRFREGLVYDTRTSVGGVNLGGYVPSAWHWVVRWSYGVLSGLAEKDTEVDVSEAWDFADVVMNLADKVQVQSYLQINEERHHQVIQTAMPDRTAASHRDAQRWVEWSVDNLHPISDAKAIQDQDYQDLVVQAAVENLAEAGRRTEVGLQEVAQRTDNRRQAQPSRAEQPPAGPSNKALQAFVETVQRSWDKADAIVSLGKTGTENGYGDAVVTISEGQDGVSIALTDGKGVNLLDAMRTRHAMLTNSADDGPAPAAQQGSEQKQAPAQAQDQKSAEQRAIDGARAAIKAADLDALKRIFHYAEQKNLLSVGVWVKPVGDGGVEIGESADDGFTSRPLSDVINRRRKALSAQAQSVPQGDEQQQNPAEPEASSEESDQRSDPTPESQGQEEEPSEDVQAEPETSEPEPTPEPEAPAEDTTPEPKPEPEAPAEAKSEQPPEGNPQAQQIADEATDAGHDVDTLQGLLDKTREADLSGEKVEAKGRRGNLEAYLKTLLKAAQRKVDSDS